MLPRPKPHRSTSQVICWLEPLNILICQPLARSMGSVVSTMSTDPHTPESTGVALRETSYPRPLPSRTARPPAAVGGRDIASLRAAALKSAVLKKVRPNDGHDSSSLTSRGPNRPSHPKDQGEEGKEDGEISDGELSSPAVSESVTSSSRSPSAFLQGNKQPPVLRSTVVTIGNDAGAGSASSSSSSESTLHSQH